MPKASQTITNKPIEYTVETAKPFDEAVRAVEEAAGKHGFRVLHTHDVAATLAEKGFHRDPIKVIEICNARYASEVLEKDVRTSLMLPCPITVYVQRGKTFMATLLPEVIASFYPEAGIEAISAEVQKIVIAIVDEAKR
ncbi:MAG TPA: DUF302 domain-containing protein [Candidatus Dormibacteraeota bacterium]|nr:DUF302 domain-containing protein [Candidatus Dormibacteraeota bacterium]